MLRSAEDWVWDSWIVDDGDRYHLFYLRAPRSLGDADLRHTRAGIGHASSVDLVEWRVDGQVLGPDPGGWDDLALWTGSVVRGPDGRWRMFYTALNSARGHGVKDQRIGLVESDDLLHWRRVTDRPVVEADPRWYKTLAEDPGASETWRDPFVYPDPGGDGWRMLITARARDGAPNDDGVLAEARSSDLIHWEVGPPVSGPGAGFGQLEVAQVRMVDEQPVLVFTCQPEEQSRARIDRWGRFCTWSVVGPSTVGPWPVADAQPFEADPYLFAAPLVRARDGGWVMIGFRNTEPVEPTTFEIIDPIPVQLANGRFIRA